MSRVPQVTALTIMTVASVPSFWTQFLPSLFDVSAAHHHEGDPDTAHQRTYLRRGEMTALGLSLVLGAGASTLAGEPWPFLGTVAMCAFLVWQYETAFGSCCDRDCCAAVDCCAPLADVAGMANADAVNRWRTA